MDWKASLETLKSSMPQEDEAFQPSANETDSARSETDCGKNETAGGFGKHPRLDVLLDRKGRKGKDATIVAGFELDDSELLSIAAKLKQKLGCGGSARGGEILIQGDKRRQVAGILSSLGFKTRVI